MTNHGENEEHDARRLPRVELNESKQRWENGNDQGYDMRR
jgi:hypothetical protein